jgi:hypothetical protein
MGADNEQCSDSNRIADGRAMETPGHPVLACTPPHGGLSIRRGQRRIGGQQIAGRGGRAAHGISARHSCVFEN